ncbi:MAG TPA: ScpA family protein [Acidimicrobiia bacterium]|nr:ScpA family protein [Acidimicrobiia bacterium]
MGRYAFELKRPAMTYHVSTAVFEGPLDLLLQLITRHQVDVTQVRLTDLVAEYLAHLEEMRLLDLDVTSEFLLIAATLIQLKAHALLPADADLDLDEELALMEERDRLLARLLTCVTFKDVAVVIRHRLQEANRYVPRVSGLDQEIAAPVADVTLPVDAEGLARIAAAALAPRAQEPDLDHLDLDLPSVQAAIDELRARVSTEVDTGFDSLVAHCRRPVEVAAYFLALLELARWGLIQVSQEDWLQEIVVRRTDDVGSAFVSEWAG